MEAVRLLALVVDSPAMALQAVLLCALLIGFTALPAPFAQTSVSVGPNVRVTRDAGGALHVEPHHGVNPRNPANLLVASMEFVAALPGGAIAVHTSFDAGTTWVKAQLPETADGADPWLSFDPDGNAYLVQIGSQDRLWRSSDGGRTWGRPVILPREDGGPYDYSKLVIDTAAVPPRIIVLATQSNLPVPGSGTASSVVLLTSTDGRTFTRTPYVPNNIHNQNGVPAVLSTGRVIVPFHELTVRGKFVVDPRFWVTTSSDGRAFSPASLVTTGYRADSPFLVADRVSAAFRDRVYAGWMGLAGEFHHYVAHSADAGATWSSPARINDSAEAKRTPTHHPMMAVNHQGVLGLTWYDGRHDAAGKCFRLYFTASLDGGKSFLPNTAVSDASSCPDTPANRRALSADGSLTVVRRFKEGGDYHGLVSLPDGSFHAIWSDSRSGSYQLWSARIRVG
jgi:hypothetical protein